MYQSHGIAGGYLLMWVAFSLGAAMMQWALEAAGLLSSTMSLDGTRSGAALLLVVGLYELTPIRTGA